MMYDEFISAVRGEGMEWGKTANDFSQSFSLLVNVNTTLSWEY